MKKVLLCAITLMLGLSTVFAQKTKEPVDYVNPLMGTDSKFSLSNGNTYPAIALPWGMNFGCPKLVKWEMVGHMFMMLIKSGDSNRPISQVHGLMIMDSSQ